jgi:hypothetical protein
MSDYVNPHGFTEPKPVAAVLPAEETIRAIVMARVEAEESMRVANKNLYRLLCQLGPGKHAVPGPHDMSFVIWKEEDDSVHLGGGF